jgi:hypothetical protein
MESFMSALLDLWNVYLDEQALMLLQEAQAIAATQEVDTNILHVLFVAATNPRLSVQKILARSIADETKLRTLVDALQQQMGSDSLHLGLDMYKLACIEVARQRLHHISNVLIVDEILAKSYAVEQLLHAHSISLVQIREALRSEMETNNIPPGAVETPQPYIASVVAKEPVNIGEILQQMRVIAYSEQAVQSTVLEKIDSSLHSITCNTLLWELPRAMRDEKIVVLIGQNGSVADQLEMMLAYRLKLMGEQIDASRAEMLAGYKLWRVSLNHLRSLYGRKRRLHPALVLNHLKEQAAKVSAILLIRGLETLTQRNAVDRKIKEELSHPDGACILGLYLYYDQKPEKEAWQLGLGETVTMAEVERYDNSTKLSSLVQRYHQPRWREQGYVVDGQAFSSLFTLEPGIWINKRRKTFPYLAIDLADDGIFTHRAGEQDVRNLAEDALVAFDDLINKEAPTVSQEVRDRFLPTLEAARDRVLALYSSPHIWEKRDGAIVITQALIEAQLFCRNNSEFHFPGLKPWPVPATS